MANDENNFENDNVSRLLGSLNHVDAPGDFDMRVRGRIAAGRPASRATWLPITARVAAAVLVLLVVGYIGFRSFGPYAVDQPAVATAPPVVDQTFASKNDDKGGRFPIPPSKEQATDPIAARPPETATPHDSDFAAKRPVVRTVSSTRGGGSRDMARGISNVITAPGHLTKDALSGMGIEANDSGSGWTVGEVKQNSRAERSGLRTGDVIESVKNKAVRIRRDGKVVQIELKP